MSSARPTFLAFEGSDVTLAVLVSFLNHYKTRSNTMFTLNY